MNNRIIKIAHLVAISVSLVIGAVAFAQDGGSGSQQNAGGGNSNQRNSNAAGGVTSSNSALQENTGAQGGGTVTNSDRRFMTDLAMSGMKEVELSRLATQRASSSEVKQFAQRMVDDHTKANQELMQLASSKGVTLPTAPDARLQSMMTRMGQTSGGDFDRRYIKEAGVKEHEKAVKLLQRVAASATDADLRAFAAKTLPIVQEHLTMARGMSSGMGSGNGAGNTNRSGGVTGNTNGPDTRQRFRP